VMGGFAEHRPELGGAALGDMAVAITRVGLVGAGDHAGIAGCVLGTGEPMDIGEDRDDREGDDRSDAGDRFEAANVVAPRAGELAQQMATAARTTYPSSVRTSTSRLRISGSSSTTRIVGNVAVVGSLRIMAAFARRRPGILECPYCWLPSPTWERWAGQGWGHPGQRAGGQPTPNSRNFRMPEASSRARFPRAKQIQKGTVTGGTATLQGCSVAAVSAAPLPASLRGLVRGRSRRCSRRGDLVWRARRSTKLGTVERPSERRGWRSSASVRSL
jgi:hypothetical protein